MFKKVGIVTVILMAVIALTGIAMAQNETTTTTTTTTAVTTTSPVVATPVMVGNKVCPVTGDVVGEPGKYTVEYKGKVYNLCCPACKSTFLADPEKYVAQVEKQMGEEKAETPAQEKAEAPSQEKVETANEMAGMKM